MKKSTVTALIISVSLMLIGAIMAVIGGRYGGMNTICWDKSQHKIVTYDPENMTAKLDKTKIEPFDSVVIDSWGADVEFIPSDDYYIEYSILTPKKDALSIEDGTLTFDDGNSRYVFISVSNLFYMGDAVDGGYIKVYYPKNADLKLVDIDLDMGDCDISNLNVQSLNSVLSMGSFRMEGSRAADMNIELDMGDLKILSSDVTKGLTAELDMGSAELSLYSINDELAIDENFVHDYGYALETEMGEVWVNGKEEGNSANLNGDVIIKISCDMGDIELELH